MTKEQTIWILTSEEEDAYDQFGEYFETYWLKKPSFGVLKKALRSFYPTDETVQHILGGGGRKAYESAWFHLREVKENEGLP